MKEYENYGSGEVGKRGFWSPLLKTKIDSVTSIERSKRCRLLKYN